MAVLDKPFAVIAAVQALIETALPGADVKYNPAKAFRPDAGGAAAVFPGEAEEQDESPLNSALLLHSLPIYLAGPAATAMERTAGARVLVAQIEAAVANNRRLGGLVDWLRVAPDFTGPSAVEALGAEAVDWVPVNLLAEYSVGR